MANARFIAIEGPDGAGISTQTALLASFLRSRDRRVVVTKEPSDGPVGSLLRQVLTGRLRNRDGSPLAEASLALLFSADRLDHLANVIEPALANGADVLCDRYTLSTLAYQSAIEDLDWLLVLNRHARSPDLTVVLDVPPEVSMARITASRNGLERYETEQQLAAVRQRFVELARAIGADLPESMLLVDGAAPIEEVHSRIRGAAERLLETE